MTPSPSAASPVPSSRSLFKSIAQASSIYGLALVGQRLVGIALLPITTRCLVPADYGVLDLLDQVGILVSTLLGVNFSEALGYFYFQSGSRPQRNRVVATTLLGAALLGAFAAGLCWPFAPWIGRMVFRTEAYTYSLRLVFIALPACFLLEGLLGWLRVENRPYMWLFGSLLRVGLTAIGIIALVAFLGMRILGVQYTAVIAGLAPAVVLGVYCFRRIRIQFDTGLFLRIAKFSAPLALSAMAMFVMHFGDRLILPRFVTFAEMGLYALAYKVGMVVSSIYGAFQIYWGAQAYGIMRRDDAPAVFARTCTYAVLGLAFACLALIVCSRPALRVLAGPAYQPAAAMIPLLVAAYGVRSIGEFFRVLFLVGGRPGYDAVCTWSASIVCLAGYALLIPPFGVWGAAAATAVNFVVFTLVAVLWTRRLNRYRLETVRLAKIAVAVGVVAGAYAAVPVSAWLAQVLWAAALVAAFPALLVLMRFPTPGEVEVVRGVLRRIERVAGRRSRLQ